MVLYRVVVLLAAAVTVAVTVIVALELKILRQGRKHMGQINQGFTDLNAAITAETAAAQAEEAAFDQLAAEVKALIAAGEDGVTSEQLESLAQTLTASQQARAASAQAALSAIPSPSSPPAPAPTPAPPVDNSPEAQVAAQVADDHARQTQMTAKITNSQNS